MIMQLLIAGRGNVSYYHYYSILYRDTFSVGVLRDEQVLWSTVGQWDKTGYRGLFRKESVGENREARARPNQKAAKINCA